MGRAVTVSGGGGGGNASSSSSSSSSESSFREHDDIFLQTQTRIWLSEVLRARLDEQMNLSELLADGELLFDVSKIVWNMLLVKCKELRHCKEPKSNLIGSRKSMGRYRPYSNVDSFLKVCKILGLNGVDLFSPSDVVEKRDTRKVCACIRSFSKKARSKQLKVPDFDIITYAVMMPTVLVGCLRRSLEFSNCSTTTSAEYTPRRDSKSKPRQKNQVGVRNRNNGFYSETSNDSEGNYMGQLTYSLSESSSHDSSCLKCIDDSPEVSSALYASKGDILELEKINRDLRHYELSCSEGQAKSFCLEYGESNPMVNSISSPTVDSHSSLCGGDIYIDNGLNNHETDFPDDASFVGDSLDNMVEGLYVSRQFAFPDITLGLDHGSVPFDGEDSAYNLLVGLDSQGSTSMERMSQNGIGRRSSDDFDDVEVSSISSMSSVFCRFLNLDADEYFDVGHLRHEIQDMDEYENFENTFTYDSGNPILETENRNSGISDKLSLSCSDSQAHAVENEEEIDSPKNAFDVSQFNPNKELCLENDEQKMDCPTMNEVNSVIRPCSKDCLIVPCDCSITGQKREELNCLNGGLNVEATQECSNSVSKFERSCLKHKGICCAELMSKDQIKWINMGNLAKLSDGKEGAKKKPPNIKPHNNPLLRTVIKGTAVFGMMFFLLRLRNRGGNEDGGGMNKKSSESQLANGTRNTMKAQRRGGENGVYPADKFKFQN